MSESSPRVCIVTPCYNQAHFLPEAIGSVCAQTYRDLEVVIVNDESPDNTSEVARRLIEGHPERRIRLVEQRNTGLPGARNAAIRTTQAEYLVSLDADDILAPDFVAQSVATLDANPEVSIADCHHQHFQDSAERIIHRPFDFVAHTHGNRLATAAMYRRRAWEEVGGFNERMCSHHGLGYEDWDFWIGCIERGHFAELNPAALYYYRFRLDGLLHQDKGNDKRIKANLVLNHPIFYSPEQHRWARGVVEGDPEALAIPELEAFIPVLGRPPVCALKNGGDFAGARRLTTLALADELCAEPELFEAYHESFRGLDETTLVVLGTEAQMESFSALYERSTAGGEGPDAQGVLMDELEPALQHAAPKVDAMLTERVVCLNAPVPRYSRQTLTRLHDRFAAEHSQLAAA